jgi:hypothetical protein
LLEFGSSVRAVDHEAVVVQVMHDLKIIGGAAA